MVIKHHKTIDLNLNLPIENCILAQDLGTLGLILSVNLGSRLQITNYFDFLKIIDLMPKMKPGRLDVDDLSRVVRCCLCIYIYKLVDVLEHVLFFHILGIIIPAD